MLTGLYTAKDIRTLENELEGVWGLLKVQGYHDQDIEVQYSTVACLNGKKEVVVEYSAMVIARKTYVSVSNHKSYVDQVKEMGDIMPELGDGPANTFGQYEEDNYEED